MTQIKHILCKTQRYKKHWPAVWFCNHLALQYKWSVCYSLVTSLSMSRICISRDPEGRYPKPHHCAEMVYEVVYSLELLFAWRTGFIFCFSGMVGCVEPTGSLNGVTASSSWHLIRPIKSTCTPYIRNMFCKHCWSWAQTFFLLLGHLGFWFRHPDKYLNGSKEKQAFEEVFLFGFSFWILWDPIHCQLRAASPRSLCPGCPHVAPARPDTEASTTFHSFSVTLGHMCPEAAGHQVCLALELIPLDWVGGDRSLLQSTCLKHRLAFPPSPAIRSCKRILWKKVLERTCEDVPHKHLNCLWAAAWPDRVCVLNPLKNSHFHGKICATRLFLSSDGLCGKGLKCNFCN